MESFKEKFKKGWTNFIGHTNIGASYHTGEDFAWMNEIGIASHKHCELVEKLKYDISILGLSQEDLTGVNQILEKL